MFNSYSELAQLLVETPVFQLCSDQVKSKTVFDVCSLFFDLFC